MKNFLLKHLVSLYCILNIILTLLIVNFFSIDEVPQQWAPAVITLFIVYLLIGKKGLKKIWCKIAFKKKYIRWYVLALIIPFIICGISYVIISKILQQEIIIPVFNHSFFSYLFFLFFIILGSIGEEIGWRGFMLPLLLKKYSYIVSSIFIGIFWGAWHLQIQIGISVFFIYILLTIEMSIVISWFCKNTNGNIVSAIILHSSVNFCALFFFENIVIDKPSNPEIVKLLYVSLVGLFLPFCIYIITQMNRTITN